MFKSLNKALFRSSLAGTVQQQLDEAQLSLLAAEAQLESAQCFVDTYKKRVERLKNHLHVAKREQQPSAPWSPPPAMATMNRASVGAEHV